MTLRLSAGAAVLRRLYWGWRILPRGLTHRTWVRRPQFWAKWTLHRQLELLQVWQLASSRASDPEDSERGAECLLWSSVMGHMSLRCHVAWSHRHSDPVWEEPAQDVSNKQGSCDSLSWRSCRVMWLPRLTQSKNHLKWLIRQWGLGQLCMFFNWHLNTWA